jgi:ankyrin repeat protein
MRAVKEGNIEVVSMLLENGANVNEVMYFEISGNV